ncbi:hypothetical protein Snoj_81510 [Streptomyces nojiriensis]|uniref:Uncharacterized protein n=1 Tax=Streptomyces nojiriensis TaxID=66374 RepID=A0ABQ3T1I7_9ACTN|nr:hypothetical protein GCM10010205_00800 [Streptomyces nojiriensis]GHI74233.1 hypothetical protein Snoj_81510 [Streptomyces nojiriensis]
MTWVMRSLSSDEFPYVPTSETTEGAGGAFPGARRVSGFLRDAACGPQRGSRASHSPTASVIVRSASSWVVSAFFGTAKP